MNVAETLTIAAQGEREILMTRVFDAPRHLVFAANTEPELLKRWLGVRSGWTMPVCEIDLRVGGRYRYVWRKESSGMEMGAGGVFREVVPPERIVCTEEFDDPWYEGLCVVTTTFTERDGRTTLTVLMTYETAEARDGVLNGPMARGVAESYNVLAEILAARAE